MKFPDIKNKKVIIGAAAGFGVNNLIEKNSSAFWLKQGQKLSQKYQSYIDSGMSEDEAEIQLKKDYPLWKKLGSRRVNALGTTAIGGLLMAAKQKEIGTGVLIAGITKFIFPSFLADLTKSE